MTDLKLFLKYYKPYKAMFLFNIFFAFLMSSLDLIFPFAVRYSIDELIPTQNIDRFYLVCIGMLIVFLSKYFVGFLVQYRGRLLGMNIETDMRRDLFTHIQKLSFSYFDNTKTGVIMSRLVNDLSGISSFVHRGPEDFFLAGVSLFGSLILMGVMSIHLTLIVILVLPLLIGFAFFNKNIMVKHYRESSKKIADINSQAENSIGGIRVVKAFTNEPFEKTKFQSKNLDFKEVKNKVFIVAARYFSGLALIMNMLHLTILFFGGKLVFNGDISMGVLVGFLLYTNKFFMPIRKMMNLMETYQKGMTGFHRFKELISISPEIEDSPDAKELKVKNGEITLEDISFSYKNVSAPILNEFSLRIKPGENIALVGNSGAGKTTISSIIPRFYEIEKGSISIDGQDIKKVTLNSLRRNIGIIQQEVFLFDGTIRENIAYGRLEATLEEITTAAKRANIYEFISSLPGGFDTEVGERGVKLSGGQKQRIAIARVFLKNPPILILDEATSSLDNTTEKLIQDSLDELSKNRTTITIAHRLSTIKDRDRIVVLDRGRIVEEGTHSELLAFHNLYSKLYRAHDLKVSTL